jgi:AcrR family transcriptional regulator
VTKARRRTQTERRTATIRKLLDAATETLIDVGYAAASVQPICERAGVSHGALFRHFRTREALMVAVGDDVAKKTLASYRGEFQALRGSEPPHVLAMRLVRMHSRSRLNQAWYELLTAARTRDELRQALEPMAVAYFDGIVELARDILPDLAERLGSSFPLVVKTVIAIFDGENMQRFVWNGSDLDEARLQLLGRLFSAVSPGA